METLTELVSESGKMRVSFLVLFGAIAVCNTNTDAKAVKFITEDEVNSISQSPVESDQKNDTTCVTIVKKSNENGEDHIVKKREISPDFAKKRAILSKKSDRKKKIESKKFKYEEHRTKTVSDKTHSRKKDKYDSQRDNNRGGRISVSNWYVPQQRPKSFSFPLIYSAPSGYNTWNTPADFRPYAGGKEYESNFMSPKDLLKLKELMDVFRNSFKEGLDSLFDAIEKELKKKLVQSGISVPNKPAAPNMNTRSSCIDTGDGSCESELADGTYDTVLPNECSDDTPKSISDSNNGIVSNDMGKRSDPSVDYLKEALPVIVKAAESILGEGIDSKKSVARDFGDEVEGVVADDEIDDRRSAAWGSGSDAAEAVADEAIDSTKSVPWDFGDIGVDNVPVE